MALVLADRVKETTTSTGTTAITLAGAATGYQTFSSAVGNANTTYYTIADQTGTDWEVGIGTYTTSGNTLSRDTVLASSNAGSLVTFTSGTKDVFVTYPAERALYTGGPLGTPSSGTLTNATGYTYANLSGTVPTWNQSTTGTAATATNLASGSVGTIPYQSASGTTAMLAAGTSGNVLTCNGAAAPTWAPASGGGGTATGASYTNPTAAGTSAAAFGSGASAAANYSTSLGANSSGSGSTTRFQPGAMALGGSHAEGTDSLAAAGGNSTNTYGALNNYSVAIGYLSKASAEYGYAIGANASATGIQNSLAIGNTASASAVCATALGVQASASGTYSTAIGYGATVSTTNQIQLGDSSSTTYVYGTVQNRSDKRDKANIRDTVLGLEFINKLRPVDFKWDFREDYKNTLQDGSKKRTRYHHGLIAQDLQKIIEETGTDFGGLQDHTLIGGSDVLSIGYDELIAPLIKAVQELSAEFNEYRRTHP